MTGNSKPKSQNTSHAVMSQRTEAADSMDNFPTPPWATRALIEHVIERGGYTNLLTCLEPACGAGHMSKVLNEYFKDVRSADVFDYGYGKVEDFLTTDYPNGYCDWIITNPPFRLAEDFIQKSLPMARRGVAVLVRTVFLESVGRYERIFSKTPPSSVAQFVERVPMVKGRLDAKASTATGYAWIVWEKSCISFPQMRWIPPCRKQLEKDDDYVEVLSSSTAEPDETQQPLGSTLLL
jgi:hypothetical protein